MTHRLIDTLERDIRNQATISSFLKLNRRQKFMIAINRYNWPLIAGLVFCFLFWVVLGMTIAHADDFADRFAGKIICPTPEPCKILVLSQQEEKILMQQNGILDTAAQARSLDLGQFAVYLKTRIAAAPAGENPKPVENKPAAPVDTPPK